MSAATYGSHLETLSAATRKRLQATSPTENEFYLGFYPICPQGTGLNEMTAGWSYWALHKRLNKQEGEELDLLEQQVANGLADTTEAFTKQFQSLSPWAITFVTSKVVNEDLTSVAHIAAHGGSLKESFSAKLQCRWNELQEKWRQARIREARNNQEVA